MLFDQGDVYARSKIGPSGHFQSGNCHCLQLKGKPHPFTMVVLTQITKAFVGRPENTLEETCTIGGSLLLSSQCTLIPICYIVVGSYSFRNQGKVLMSVFHDGFAYKSPYIVGLFRYTHHIPSTTTSDLRQRETRTFVGRSYSEIVRSQKGTLQANELGSEGFSNGMDAKCYLWCIA